MLTVCPGCTEDNCSCDIFSGSCLCLRAGGCNTGFQAPPNAGAWGWARRAPTGMAADEYALAQMQDDAPRRFERALEVYDGGGPVYAIHSEEDWLAGRCVCPRKED